MVNALMADPILIRKLGHDEKWLQDQIMQNPNLLGLGAVEVAAKEHKQPSGGRIDFLMRNLDGDMYYEVEVMLGSLDESHIIRTIEYWDIERQRRPLHDHQAVIVAENITARFFNVLRLLNRSVPLKAVQLSAFKIGSDIYIHPTVVLDVFGEIDNGDSVDPVERTDRQYWEKKVNIDFLKTLDKIGSIVSKNTSTLTVNVTYNRSHIAIGTSGHNFCWLRPRDKGNRTHIGLRFEGFTQQDIESVIQELSSAHVEATKKNVEQLTFIIKLNQLDQEILQALFVKAENCSRRQ